MKWLIGAVLLLAAANSVFAQNDPIAARRSILKGFGEATKAPSAMLKGDAPFDLAVVQKTLKTYSEGAKALPALFPDTSKTGDTAALPRIWDEKPRFEALYAKLDQDATAASAAITDEASFKREFPKQLGNCKACHDDFRGRRP